MSHRLISAVVLASVALLIVGSALFGQTIAESFEKPDYAKMRAYRMSLLTDAQVVALHDRAVADHEKHKQIAADQDAEFWTNYNRAVAECDANPAAKLRDNCHIPMTDGMLSGGNQAQVETVDALFESYVMGFCDMVDSVREAKQHRCLPP